MSHQRCEQYSWSCQSLKIFQIVGKTKPQYSLCLKGSSPSKVFEKEYGVDTGTGGLSCALGLSTKHPVFFCWSLECWSVPEHQAAVSSPMATEG